MHPPHLPSGLGENERRAVCYVVKQCLADVMGSWPPGPSDDVFCFLVLWKL